MLEPEVVRQVRQLAGHGWGSRRISRELGVARNTIKRYLRGGEAAERQERPRARLLGPALRAEALRLFETEAQGNAVVVRDLLAERGVRVTGRTVQRLLRARRQPERPAKALVGREAGRSETERAGQAQKSPDSLGFPSCLPALQESRNWPATATRGRCPGSSSFPSKELSE